MERLFNILPLLVVALSTSALVHTAQADWVWILVPSVYFWTVALVIFTPFYVLAEGAQ